MPRSGYQGGDTLLQNLETPLLSYIASDYHRNLDWRRLHARRFRRGLLDSIIMKWANVVEIWSW